MDEPKKPNVVELRALQYLGRFPDGTGCSILGGHLWPENRTGHVVASQGGGDYAAQMLLGRMRKKGWVEVLWGTGSSMWALTKEGRRVSSETVISK